MTDDDMAPRFLEAGYPEWPAGFDTFSYLFEDAPQGLWVRGAGNLRTATDRSVAVVGSRSSTAYGSSMATAIAAGLAADGAAIVAGGAFGIDVAAHRAAMYRGVPTVAVLACGVDRVYPGAHQQLFERILETGGFLVSEQPLGTPPSKERFLRRNRLVAAMTQATVIVEAGLRSGTMSTAAWAWRLGRPVFAVPGPVTSVQSKGPHDLIRAGRARLVTHAYDVLGDLAGREPAQPFDYLPEARR